MISSLLTDCVAVLEGNHASGDLPPVFRRGLRLGLFHFSVSRFPERKHGMSAGRTREAHPISEGGERFVQSLPDYKPVSVPLRAVVIRLGQALLTGSSDLPESRTERAAPPPLFGLAPRGVYPASRITPAAVRSYRTFSPLPEGGVFSVALSVKSALSESPRPLAGTLPYGDRTFLPLPGDHPSGRLVPIITPSAFPSRFRP